MKKKRHARKHLFIPDLQVKPGVPLDHLYWLGQYARDQKPDVIVQIGDWADMESLSSYDVGKRSYEGRRYKADIEAVRTSLGVFQDGLGSYSPERQVITLGNHEDRIDRAIDDDPKLDGTISTQDLGFATFGWEVVPFLRPITIDGIAYAHYFVSGKMGRPCTSARAMLSKHHGSCIAGHQQGRDIAYGNGPAGNPITAIMAGSFYQHDESYMPWVVNRHWRGVYILHEVKDGSFDEMPVSIGYLRNTYGGTGYSRKFKSFTYGVGDRSDRSTRRDRTTKVGRTASISKTKKAKRRASGRS